MKQKKNIVLVLLIVFIVVIGLSLAFFSNSTTFKNLFNTKEYGTTIKEEFVSPNNWVPGPTTQKNVVVKNTGQIDEAVRISFNEEWISKNNNILDNYQGGQKISLIKFINNEDWIKITENGKTYYYYNNMLAPGQTTSSLIESVTFNPNITIDSNCVTANDNGLITKTCSSTGDSYDDATYRLVFNIETVQYDKYKNAWDTTYDIGTTLATTQLINNANNINSDYDDETKYNMFVFDNDDIRNYRYIGNDPNNYVYFNCSDDSDINTCEIWRIIGVFNMIDENGNMEPKIKIIKNNILDTYYAWNSDNINEWSISSINDYLNDTYYSSMSSSSKTLLDDTNYYFGGIKWIDTNNHWGTTEVIYNNERGNNVYDQTRTKVWNGKLSLMYPSDNYYTYANGVDNECFLDPYNCSNGRLNGWIYNSNNKLGNQYLEITWTLTPNATSENYVFNIGSGGDLDSFNSSNERGIRPVAYLINNVKIESGTGESSSPYLLKKVG